VRRRHELARQYDTLLDDFPVIRPWQSPDGYSSFHLYIVRLKPRELKVTHRKVFESMRTQGIGVNLHYIPVHLQPYYETMGFRPGDFPEAERYYAEAMSLPLFPLLQTGDIESIVNSLRQAIA
jgi:dTDP-4-amino-4,6-dideoxygalactose transaminase